MPIRRGPNFAIPEGSIFANTEGSQSGGVPILPIRRGPNFANPEGSSFANPEESNFAIPEGSYYCQSGGILFCQDLIRQQKRKQLKALGY